MRQAINNLQSTVSGFEFVSSEAVFKVCDQPHPIVIKQLLAACEKGEIQVALESLDELWSQGYSAVDIVTTLFRVVKGMDRMAEYLKLEFIKVSLVSYAMHCCQPRLAHPDGMFTPGNWVRAHAHFGGSQHDCSGMLRVGHLNPGA